MVDSVSPRSTPDPLVLARFSTVAKAPGGLQPTDAELLRQRGVLTTSQLVRLAGLPERTVVHRLGRLDRAGLVNRFRPRVPELWLGVRDPGPGVGLHLRN